MEQPKRTIAFRRVVDLTHPIKPGIPLWPGDPPVQFETTASLAAEGYFLRRFSMGEHSGTHISTPSAFFDQGSGPDSIPPEALITPAVVIDSRSSAGLDPDHVLTVEEIADWERRHGKIAAGSTVLLLTGWRRYWDEPETVHQPGRRRPDAHPRVYARGGVVSYSTNEAQPASGPTPTASMPGETPISRRAGQP